MGRTRWIRLAAVGAALGLACLLSGCVIVAARDFGPQEGVIGDMPQKFALCASGSTGCASLGTSGTPAVTGAGQILLGVRVPDTTSVPSSFTSAGPEALTFTQSPSYAAEARTARGRGPGPGAHWVGFVSAVVDYAADGPGQSLVLALPHALRPGADGSPFPGPFTTRALVGARAVSAVAPASRPVVCGPSLTQAYDEVNDEAQMPPPVSTRSMSG